MICNNCGSENRQGAKFCDECGSLLPTEPSEVVLPPEVPEVVSSVEDTQTVDGFDFSPIDVDDAVDGDFDTQVISENETQKFDDSGANMPEYRDMRGIDEIVAGHDYRLPESAWGAGDTMKMPRVGGQEPDQQREFKAPDASSKKKPARNRRITVAIILVVVLLFGGGAIAIFVDWPDGTNLADSMGLSAILGGKKIPDVTDLDKEKATKELEERGFKVKAMNVKSDETEGSVLMTDPVAGSRLPEGETVVLQVAISRTVPEVTGKLIDDAQALFSSEGLTHVKVVTEKSNEPEGTVLKVVPEQGSKAVSTSDITVTVAEPFKVPEVVGKDYDSALAALEAEGYQVYVAYAYSESSEGTVLASDPAAGSVYNSGGFVTLTLAKSRGSELVELTQARYGEGFEISGTSYWVSSMDSVDYIGNDTVSCVITCSISYTTPTGETLTGETKQRTFTVSFDSDNNSSIAAS